MSSSQALRDARRYEEIYEKLITPDQRPMFHLIPRTGWMNDPNGFSYYYGQYHMFYQYYPYSSLWGPMHWGHAVSKDLLHWEYLPAALAPDEFYDQDGCFSGSAITLDDGRQLLMYTAVIMKKRWDGSRMDMQTQSIAVGNGIDYEKYEGNPVLDENDLPEDSDPRDFRDPKIWKDTDGMYRCVAASRIAGPEKDSRLLLFQSRDGFHWEFQKVLITNGLKFGRMWECPDFFELDGKQVILVSPQDMEARGFEYHNGNGTVCLIGSYDKETFDFTPEHDQAIDYGIDFYAPQTVLTPDGRRVMIGWMQNWDSISIRDPEALWAGQMTLPRELSIRNGRLYQWPVKELDLYRRNRVEYRDVHLTKDRMYLKGVTGRTVDMEIRVRPVDPEKSYQKFVLRFAEDWETYTSIRFRPSESTLKIDRKFSGSRRAIVHQRRCYVEDAQQELRLRIILDRNSCEIFIDGGRKVMTATLYTDYAADNISFRADGDVVMDIVKYDIVM